MRIKNLFTDDRAVSPVVGVALLIAIAVILAAVIGAVVLGLGTGGVDTPQAQLQGELLDDGSVEINHNGGEPIPAGNVYLASDNDDHELETELTAGGSVDQNDFDGTLAFTAGDEYALIWEDPNSDSETVLETWKAE